MDFMLRPPGLIYPSWGSERSRGERDREEEDDLWAPLALLLSLEEEERRLRCLRRDLRPSPVPVDLLAAKAPVDGPRGAEAVTDGARGRELRRRRWFRGRSFRSSPLARRGDRAGSKCTHAGCNVLLGTDASGRSRLAQWNKDSVRE